MLSITEGRSELGNSVLAWGRASRWWRAGDQLWTSGRSAQPSFTSFVEILIKHQEFSIDLNYQPSTSAVGQNRIEQQGRRGAASFIKTRFSAAARDADYCIRDLHSKYEVAPFLYLRPGNLDHSRTGFNQNIHKQPKTFILIWIITVVIIQYTEQIVHWSTGVNNNVVIIQLFTKHADQSRPEQWTTIYTSWFHIRRYTCCCGEKYFSWSALSYIWCPRTVWLRWKSVWINYENIHWTKLLMNLNHKVKIMQGTRAYNIITLINLNNKWEDESDDPRRV